MPQHDSDTRSMGLYAAALAAALLLPLSSPIPAARAETATPSARLRLVAQRPWLSPGAQLGVTLRVTNVGTTGLDGFLLRVGVYDRVTSRSDLHVSFGGTPDVPASAFTKYFSSTKLPAGKTVDIHLRDPVETLPTFGVRPDGGVFPLTVYLYDATGAQLLDSLTTSLIYYPQSPPVPLNLVVLVPLNTLPAKSADGVFHADPAGNYPLADALGPSGWLNGMLGAWERWTHPPSTHRRKPKRHHDRRNRKPPTPPRLRFALAPSPRLISEIADLSNGYLQEQNGKVVSVGAQAPTARRAARFLRRVRSLTASAGVQTMLTPYSSPDLPALNRNFDLEHLARQLTAGDDVLRSSLGVSAGWLFTPEGRLDAATLDNLRLAGAAQHAVVSPRALEDRVDPAAGGCPSTFATFACPIRLRSENSTSVGFLSDTGLEQRLAVLEKPRDDQVDLQRFLAETAMIHAETPGVSGRVVEATTPPLWHPNPALANSFFQDLARAPWLHTSTPDEGLRKGHRPVSKHLVVAAPRIRDEPAASYFDAISGAEAQVEHYATTLSDTTRPPALLALLRQDVLVAQSRLWWSSPATEAEGATYAGFARARATSELHKVSIGGVNEISMTSQRAQIPFVLSSRADHPVTVDVTLFSPKLGFDRSELKGIVVEHGTQQIAVQATAQASGIFPVEVTVETSDGYVLARKSIQIRSTNFNQIALALTLGALVFLIAFYVWGVVKKRRGRAAGPTAGTSTA